MKDKKEKIIIISIISLLVLGLALFFGYDYFKKDSQVTKENNNANIKTEEEDNIDWNSYESSEIKDASNVEITKGGVYTLSGTITGGVTINTEEDVKLILNNVNIKNSKGPAIYVISANNTVIYLNEGTTNTVEDGSAYSGYDQDVNACIYSKDDLTFDGTGSLTVKANYQDGIVSKDDLKIVNGTYSIKVNDDGIKGKDSVYILNGTFNITAGGDGIKASNDSDSEKGYVLIENGKFTISAKSDGIQAITKLVINNGTFDITASEGLEATYIVINDGDININASDDGINASTKSDFMTPTIEVNGGTINVTMGQGDTDGFDVNGTIYINGGTVKVTGQSTFDYDGEGKINGGTVYVNGEKVSELPNQFAGGDPGGNQGGGPGQDPNMNGQRGGRR